MHMPGLTAETTALPIAAHIQPRHSLCTWPAIWPPSYAHARTNRRNNRTPYSRAHSTAILPPQSPADSPCAHGRPYGLRTHTTTLPRTIKTALLKTHIFKYKYISKQWRASLRTLHFYYNNACPYLHLRTLYLLSKMAATRTYNMYLTLTLYNVPLCQCYIISLNNIILLLNFIKSPQYYI
ncbi:hypothetical protein FKM82_003526 [Ascaphus truei]